MGKSGAGGLLRRDTPTEEGSLPKDEIFDLMSNHRRRYIIHHCKRENEPITLSDLAEQVAAWEKDKTIDELGSAERKTVYTSLQQTHLPRLERAGIITYDDGEVELTERTERLDIYLDIVPENSIPWGVYYLGLSLLSCVVVAGLWAGVLPTGAIPALTYPTVIVAAFTVSATYHSLTNRRYRFENFDQPP
ncbi:MULTISPECIES: hypothetical protein [Haloferax]|uniref:DUF7344 domain-containing protein n=1 Tax=Haloferax marinum TaxID=2666143 RepID=A0A6A8G7H7_9EURY|nr:MULTISPECIES: hypothetical protein [Haloferax]KAB1198160.1 hypothetical protein Hfx1150_11780 [Haloferax sp. CBA1150]MRW97240.1 hypothetical protein [Haloferax marinum]